MLYVIDLTPTHVAEATIWRPVVGDTVEDAAMRTVEPKAKDIIVLLACLLWCGRARLGQEPGTAGAPILRRLLQLGAVCFVRYKIELTAGWPDTESSSVVLVLELSVVRAVSRLESLCCEDLRAGFAGHAVLMMMIMVWLRQLEDDGFCWQPVFMRFLPHHDQNTMVDCHEV